MHAAFQIEAKTVDRPFKRSVVGRGMARHDFSRPKKGSSLLKRCLVQRC